MLPPALLPPCCILYAACLLLCLLLCYFFLNAACLLSCFFGCFTEQHGQPIECQCCRDNAAEDEKAKWRAKAAIAVANLRRQDIQLLAIDLDQTLVKVHTGTQCKLTAAQLAAEVSALSVDAAMCTEPNGCLDTLSLLAI